MRIPTPRARPLLLLLLLAALPAGAQRRDPLAGLDAYIEKAMADWRVPGLAVAVVRGDSVIYAKGFGVRRAGRPERVDEHTVFAVASNTKAVTATALGLLVAEGKLSWDDRAAEHLPWFQLRDPWATRELTVRDLLAHRTGHATWQGDLLWYGSDRSVRQVLEGVRHLAPVTSFRSAYGYNNLGFNAAGEIIPVATGGTGWADFVTQRLLRPLGMTRTTTSVRALEGVDNVARPHTLLDGAVAVVPYRDLDNGPAAAALNSSASDWARWLKLQLAYGRWEGRQLVDSAVIRETRTSQTVLPIGGTTRRLFPSTHFSTYGLGWFLRDYQGRLVVSHSGGMDGMLSQTGFLPEEGIGVVVLTNFDEQSLYAALFWEIVDRLLGVPPRDWSRVYLDLQASSPPADPEAGRARDTRPSVALERYAGTYTSDVLGEASVTLENGALRLRVVHNPGIDGPLSHWHYDTFQARWRDRYLGTSLVTFALDAAGTPESFRMQVRPDFVDPQEYVFRRVGP